EFVNEIPLNFQSILKQFNLDLDQISKKAQETPSVQETPPETLGTGKEETSDNQETTFDRFRLTVKEFITSGAGSEKIELSWRREGEDTSAIETAEVITSNGSMPFNNSPDPLNAAITTFDRIYYDDIISKVREELDYEEESE
ncbi:MAG: hypothetical protein ACOC3V_04795, partial [bacterium]